MSDHLVPTSRPPEVQAEYEDSAEVRGVIIDGAVAEPYLPH